MSEAPPRRSFFKAFGPGLLWAGAAIGVSHLVQSTRAGANFGFALILVIVVANIFKYPAFSFGPRYAAATGTSLLEGYRRRGKYALVLYAIITVGSMFFVQAAVTMVTAALGCALLGLKGLGSIVWLSAALTVICAALLLVGRYRLLDKLVKVVVAVLTVSTLSATLLVVPKIPWGEMSFLPSGDIFTTLWVAALIGWMPSAFDISVWNSLWTIARRRETGYAPTVRESLLDFNIGYFGTALLSLCFLTLGAGVMFTAGKTFDQGAATFAGQVVSLYVDNLGAWSKPLIAVSAFTVMFSTTQTVVDGYPRAIACLVSRFREPEVPDHPSATSRKVYWLSIVGIGAGSLLLIFFASGSLKALVDKATTLSFLLAPGLAWLNHRAMLGDEVPAEHRPGPKMTLYSRAGIVFSTVFAAYYLYVRFLR